MGVESSAVTVGTPTNNPFQMRRPRFRRRSTGKGKQQSKKDKDMKIAFMSAYSEPDRQELSTNTPKKMSKAAQKHEINDLQNEIKQYSKSFVMQSSAIDKGLETILNLETLLMENLEADADVQVEVDMEEDQSDTKILSYRELQEHIKDLKDTLISKDDILVNYQNQIQIL